MKVDVCLVCGKFARAREGDYTSRLDKLSQGCEEMSIEAELGDCVEEDGIIRMIGGVDRAVCASREFGGTVEYWRDKP